MELEDFEYNFIDQIFDYEGLWGIKAKCGLKVAKTNSQTVVVLTDLYDENSGGSITDNFDELLQVLCSNFSIDTERLRIIQHTPEVNSNLDFYDEIFYDVRFKIQANTFLFIGWDQITRKEVELIIPK